jgi:hypothetical protein
VLVPCIRKNVWNVYEVIFLFHGRTLLNASVSTN